MLSFTGCLKVFLAVEAVDMRKSIDGLYGIVTERLSGDPRSGALFVFTNRPRTRLKVLYWDGTGFWLLTKRLEKGTFCWPKLQDIDGSHVSLDPTMFSMLTDGIDLLSAKKRPWYLREKLA